MKLRLTLLGTFLAGSVLAQVGLNTPATAISADMTPSLTGHALWKGEALPGLWRDVSTAGGKTSKELVSLGLIFGVRPQQVQAFFENDQLARIEVVWLETGNFFGFRESKEADARDTRELPPSERARLEREKREKEKAEEAELAPKRKEFAARFQQLERSLPVTINTVTKTQGKRVTLGNQGLLRSRVTEWVVDEVNLRFVAEDDQLIGLTIQRAATASRKFADTPGGAARRRDAKEAVQQFPNGDETITTIPVFNQGGRGYCAIGTLAMVTQYYGLSLNIDQLAAKAGYKEGDTENAKIQPIYQAAAREAKLRLTENRSLTFQDAMRAIEKGKPLIVWRFFSRERDEFHSVFAHRFAADPTLQLPDPRKNRADRDRWPDESLGGHASVITGFNKKRNEIIFTESWGEGNRNRRMRAEEMEATVYAVFLLEP